MSTQVKVAMAAHKVQGQVKGALAGLRIPGMKKEEPKPPSGQVKLIQTARVLWILSYSILWIGLVPRGWQKTEYQGSQVIAGQTYHQTYIGYYGLWDVVFQLTSSQATIPYAIWGSAQKDQLPLVMVQLTELFMMIATAAGAVVFLAYFRGWCSRDAELETWCHKLAAWATIPQILGSGLAVLTWKFISPEAFQVFCTEQGCVKEDPAAITAMTVSYSWVFVMIASIVSLFLSLTMFRVAWWVEPVDESEEVEVELEAQQQQRRAAPSTGTGKKASIGPKTPVDYLPVAKVSETPKEALPSWLREE